VEQNWEFFLETIFNDNLPIVVMVRFDSEKNFFVETPNRDEQQSTVCSVAFFTCDLSSQVKSQE
jgi:hypothetical protein